MSVGFILIFTCLVIVFLGYKLLRLSKQVQQQQHDIRGLEKLNTSLKDASFIREQHLDVLLSTVSEVVLRVDKQGRVLGGNSQAVDLFRLDEVTDFPQSLLMFYRDHEWIEAYLHAIHILPEQKDLPEMHIQGRVFLPRLASVGDNEGILLCTDITAYTLLQRKQKSLLENLMHDLKTPLTSLLGYARSIEAFGDDEALRTEAAKVIAQEAKHINSLVNSMLTLNQIESQASAEDVTCDVREVLQQVWQGLDYAMKQKDVTLDLNVGKAVDRVAMQDVDCLRILMNVADNALRFSPKGGTIRCHAKASDSVVSITIQDEGYGVSEKHIKRITERFYRVDDVRGRDKAQGHGLGLAIVKETLERDGGELDICNAEPSGLKITLHIPKA